MGPTTSLGFFTLGGGLVLAALNTRNSISKPFNSGLKQKLKPQMAQSAHESN